VSKRHYSDQEWAAITAGAWRAEQTSHVRMLMTTKRTIWSSDLAKEYGWVLCPIRRPSRALVTWLVEFVKDRVTETPQPVFKGRRQEPQSQVVEGQVKGIVSDNG